jgi:hypothetical protein
VEVAKNPLPIRIALLIEVSTRKDTVGGLTYIAHSIPTIWVRTDTATFGTNESVTACALRECALIGATRDPGCDVFRQTLCLLCLYRRQQGVFERGGTGRKRTTWLLASWARASMHITPNILRVPGTRVIRMWATEIVLGKHDNLSTGLFTELLHLFISHELGIRLELMLSLL